jgi:hypothetical protein
MDEYYEMSHVKFSNLDFKETEEQLQTSYDIDAFEVVMVMTIKSTSGM